MKNHILFFFGICIYLDLYSPQVILYSIIKVKKHFTE